MGGFYAKATQKSHSKRILGLVSKNFEVNVDLKLNEMFKLCYCHAFMSSTLIKISKLSIDYNPNHVI